MYIISPILFFLGILLFALSLRWAYVALQREVQARQYWEEAQRLAHTVDRITNAWCSRHKPNMN